MTRAARRATTLLLAALTAMVLSVALLSGPALAADDGVGGQAAEDASTSDSEPVHAVASEAEGFGTGMWDGMMLAAVTGVILGFVVFAMSRPGEIERAGHHDANHGHGDQQMAP